MAEKRYKLTSAVVASPSYVANGNEYQTRIGFQRGTAPPLVICNPKQCPLITCTGSDVLGTTNDWAQKFMDVVIIPKGMTVNGSPYFGTPGVPIFEETSDPVTIDLDNIFPP